MSPQPAKIYYFHKKPRFCPHGKVIELIRKMSASWYAPKDCEKCDQSASDMEETLFNIYNS